MFGGGSSAQTVQPPAQPVNNNTMNNANEGMCLTDERAFLKCLEKNGNDISAW